nr:immunoglobulin light chain junction region [Macaca mulatta]
CQHSYDTPYSS